MKLFLNYIIKIDLFYYSYNRMKVDEVAVKIEKGNKEFLSAQ